MFFSTTESEQREVYYIEAVRISVIESGVLLQHFPADINEQISELLHQSIHSEGVINLFQDFERGLVYLIKFLSKIEKMEQKIYRLSYSVVIVR